MSHDVIFCRNNMRLADADKRCRPANRENTHFASFWKAMTNDLL